MVTWVSSWRKPIQIRERRLFIRIFLYFLTLMIPLLVISGGFYINYANVVKDDFAAKIASSTASSAQNVEMFLSTSQEASLNFIHNQTVSRYFLPDDYLTVQEKAEMASIPKVISRSGSVSMNYNDIMFVYNDDQRVYLSDGVEAFDLFFSKFYSMAEYPADFWLKKLRSGKTIEILPPTTLSQSGKQVIPFLMRGMVNGHEVMVVNTIPVDKLRQSFRSNAIFADTEFVILDENHKTILNTDPGRIPTERLLAEQPSGGGETLASLELEMSGVSSVATVVGSSAYGWTYYAVTPVHAINEHIRGIFNFILILCLVMLAIGISLSFLFSVKIYNPIRYLRDFLEEPNSERMELPHAQARSELDDIGHRIKQLYDTQTRFRNKFEEVSTEYLDNELLHLLRGRRTEKEETIQHMLESEFGFRSGSYLVCNLLFDFDERYFKEVQDVDRFAMLGKVKKVITGLLREGATCYVVEYRPSLYTCVFDVGEPVEDGPIEQGIQQIFKTFEYDFNYCSIYFGIGKPCRQVSDLAASFSDAMTAIQHRSPLKQFEVIDARKLQIPHHFLYSQVDERRIQDWLKDSEWELLEEKVDEIIRVNRERGVSHAHMRMLFTEMFQTGYKLLLEQEIDVSRSVPEPVRRMLWDSSELALTDSENRTALLEFYKLILQQTEAAKPRGTVSLVDAITEYIDRNYRNDLYLEKIAEEVGGSAKYLSRIFKEKTNTNLTDYINLVRISKAKELLSRSDMTISDVGEYVGIYSRTTFLRIFKKMEGITPLEYRRKHRAEG